jgi:hypothetical protein
MSSLSACVLPAVLSTRGPTAPSQRQPVQSGPVLVWPAGNEGT